MSFKLPIQTSSNLEQRPGCIAKTLGVIGDKWTALIVRDLASAPKRFCALEDSLGGISPRTLSQRLEALEQSGVIQKQAYCKNPPRMEYSLSQKGQDLLPILQRMADWGMKH